MAPAALIRIEGTEIDIILNTNRTQAFEPDIFSNLGLDPSGKDILLVKSTNHFHAGFAPIAAGIIYVSAREFLPQRPGGDEVHKTVAADLAAGCRSAPALTAFRRRCQDSLQPTLEGTRIASAIQSLPLKRNRTMWQPWLFS